LVAASQGRSTTPVGSPVRGLSATTRRRSNYTTAGQGARRGFSRDRAQPPLRQADRIDSQAGGRSGAV